MQSVLGHLSKYKPYGRPNIKRLGFTWAQGHYGQYHLTPERAALYTREVLLPIMRQRGGRVQTTVKFLAGHTFPQKAEEDTRDSKIVSAMKTYTGRRTKRQGWPWIVYLRKHAGMPDITATDRRRLWSQVTE